MGQVAWPSTSISSTTTGTMVQLQVEHESIQITCTLIVSQIIIFSDKFRVTCETVSYWPVVQCSTCECWQWFMWEHFYPFAWMIPDSGGRLLHFTSQADSTTLLHPEVKHGCIPSWEQYWCRCWYVPQIRPNDTVGMAMTILNQTLLFKIHSNCCYLTLPFFRHLDIKLKATLGHASS